MNRLALVFLGGGIGSVCRYLTGVIFTPLNTTAFPLATFTANIFGCFIIGIFFGKINLSKNMNLLFVTGFCGGFTTFSTFSKESLTLIENAQFTLAITYIISSILIGTIFVMIGYYITNKTSAIK